MRACVGRVPNSDPDKSINKVDKFFGRGACNHGIFIMPGKTTSLICWGDLRNHVYFFLSFWFTVYCSQDLGTGGILASMSSGGSMNVKDAIIDLIGGTAGKLVAHRDLRDPSGTEYIVILFIYRRDCLCVCGSTPGHGQSEDADLSKHLLPRDDSLCPGDPEEGRSGPGTVRWHAPCTGGQCVRECRPFCSLWSLPKDCGHFLCSGRIQSGDDGTRRGGGGVN